MAVADLPLNNAIRYGINGYTEYALPAYITAVTAVETFINETMLGLTARNIYSLSPLWNLGRELVEKLELGPKMILVPQMLFNQSLRRSEATFANMMTLIKVRNALVHFKVTTGFPDYIRDLEARGIALPHPPGTGNPWTDYMSSTEGIRWANNTAGNTVHALVNFIPEEHRDLLGGWLAKNFTQIRDTVAKDYLISQNINPTSNYPER